MADDAFLIHAYNFFGGFSLQVLLSLFWKDFFYYCMQGVQKKNVQPDLFMLAGKQNAVLNFQEKLVTQ